jgi:hypothetical protein
LLAECWPRTVSQPPGLITGDCCATGEPVSEGRVEARRGDAIGSLRHLQQAVIVGGFHYHAALGFRMMGDDLALVGQSFSLAHFSRSPISFNLSPHRRATNRRDSKDAPPGAGFAVPRCWSRGFEPPVLFGLFLLGNGAEVQAFFGLNLPTDRSENISPTRFIGTALPKTSGFRTVSQEQKTQKGPAVRIPAPATSQSEPPVPFT